MSDARFAALKLRLCRAALIVALPCACATGVKPELDDSGDDTSEPTETAGSSTGGMPETAGTSALPHAGTTATGGNTVSNPFGGTSSAGKSSGGTSSAGAASGGSGAGGKAGSGAGGKAGSSAGGSAGAGGKGGAGGGGGASSGGAATGSCATCPMPPKTWADNTNISFGPGDCFDVSGALYLYTGTDKQTWANKDCNPSKQLSWCPGSGYNFMLCK